MKKYITIFSLVFLVGCSIIFYENYIDPVKVKTVYIDTCFVDSVVIDTVKVDSKLGQQ